MRVRTPSPSQSSPTAGKCRQRSSLSSHYIQHNHLAAMHLNSCTTESWEITNHCCFKLLNLGLICYIAIDNWYNMIFQWLSGDFSGSLNHTENNLQTNKVKYNSCTLLLAGMLKSDSSGPTVLTFTHNFNVFVHLRVKNSIKLCKLA